MTACSENFSSGLYKLSLVTNRHVTSVCHALDDISEQCVCGSQVHSGREKRSTGKKHNELDLICHLCPEGSLSRSQTHTHTLYAFHHFTNKITYVLLSYRHKHSWQKCWHEGSLSWNAVLYLRETQRKNYYCAEVSFS